MIYMKNTLGDLNNHLFAQLEKLGDEDLNGDELEAEIRRSEAMAKVGEQIIRTGELQLKAMNHMEVGEYTHTTDGYLVRKVREQGTQRERFEFVHRKVWEEHYGPVPEGKMVSFLDGDKDNCDVENLVLLDNSENLEMNRSSLRFPNAELTKAGVNIAKVKVAVGRRKRN